MGHRLGRLRGRRLPAGLERVERPLPRHGARLLARRRGHAAATSPRASAGSARPLRPRRPAPDGVGQLRHRRTTASRWPTSSLRRQAQRGQRRGQPRRHRRQPQLELRRRGSDRRPRDRSPCARASSATCWPRCCSPQGVPHAPRRRRARAAPRAATTTPTARTTPSPGSTGNGRPASAISPTSPRRLCRLRRDHPAFRRRQFFRGAAAPRGTDRRPRLVPPRRAADGPRRLGRGLRPGRRGRPERRARGRGARPTTRSCSCSTPGGSRSPSSFPPSRRGWCGASRSTPRIPRPGERGRATRRPGRRPHRGPPLTGPSARRNGLGLTVPSGPVLIGYDGSPSADHALREAAALFGRRQALVVVVWEAGAAYETLDVPDDPRGAHRHCARPRWPTRRSTRARGSWPIVAPGSPPSWGSRPRASPWPMM